MSALARRSVGTVGLWVMDVSASAPMTVLAGAVVTMYATTGIVAVPVAFLLLAGVLGLLSVGYVGVSRRLAHAAPFYAVLARGLGRWAGLCGASVALVGYNALQLSLYGLFGASLAGLAGGAWWAWALVAWAAVAGAGVLRIRLGAGLVAVLVGCEVVVIGLIVLGAFLHPVEGRVSLVPVSPAGLVSDGVGGVLAFGVACFLGFESAAALREEAATDRGVGRATVFALLFLGPFYTLAAWAVALAVGPDHVVDAARTDPALIMTVIARSDGVFGPLLATAATGLLITSVLGAMVSFHSTVARYVFALARERVLPAGLARTGSGSRQDAPTGGSLAQSGLALVVVGVFAMLGADPVATMFTWLGATAAVALLVALVAASVAAIGFFRTGDAGREGVWTHTVGPVLGIVAGVFALGVIVANLQTLLGLPPGSTRSVLVPAVVFLALVAGLVWALLLRAANPDVYAAIGRRRRHELAIPDARLNEVRLG